MKAIQYIGKKPQRSDSVADTGLVWAPGQVHIVTDAVAERLLAHPDVWASVPIEAAMAGSAKPDVTDAKPKKASTPEDDTQTAPSLGNMNLMELRKYAKTIGVSLPAKITEATARRKLHDEVRAQNLRGRGG